MDDVLYWRDEKVVVPPAVDWSVMGDLMPDGIYFGMDEDEYHAAPALSTTGIKHLMISPMDFWARCEWLNPDRDDEATDAKDMGKAYHARVIEGRETFLSRYAPALDPNDYPNALTTNDEIKEALKHAGLPTGGNKATLIERLVEHDPSAEIWETLRAEHFKAHAGRDLLPRTLMDKIELSAAMIEKHPQLGKAFSGGMPEVSIFWRDPDGIPMKARMDYLKREAVVDLKTFSNPSGKPIDRAVTYAMAAYKYHIQVAVYLEAVQQAKQFIRDGLIFGEVDKDFCKKVAATEEHTFLFVFQQTGVAPVARGYVFPRYLTYDCGKIEVRNTKALFADCVGRFGKSHWVDLSSIRTLEDAEFPAFMTAG